MNCAGAQSVRTGKQRTPSARERRLTCECRHASTRIKMLFSRSTSRLLIAAFQPRSSRA